ncbi:MAG: T9SS type A sorting domain-containing protein, partial [Candidatus Delongbacteria bacterium]|nr:T9SS type A sorting domain-containing protein [Candidatus Delongbacteria bacterium]
GAVFQMGQGAEIIVSGNGSLKADGVSLAYAGDEGGKWLGINCKAESSIDLNNVHITNAVTGVRGFYNHKFEVTNCIMENCDNGIETIELTENVYYNITGNTLTGTKSGTGVSIFGSNGKFRENNITFFYVGANFTNCSPEIVKNTIEYNKAYGILISGQNAIPQLINTDLNQVYNELNNTIANNGNTTLGSLIFPSSQIGIRPYSSVYMQNGHNNVYRGEFNIPPALPCISIENKVSSMTSVVINAQNNYWGSYDVTDEFFDGPTQYTLIYEPYSKNIYSTGGSEPSNSQSYQTPENNILTNAMRMEAEEKYRAAINLYELVIKKYVDTPEYYVAMSRLPYLYSLLEEDSGKLISLYDQAHESQNTTNKKFFKSMKVETYIRINKHEDAITVAEEMKADAESEEEIILADINITIAKLLMNSKGKNEAEVNDLRTLIANLMESEDKGYTEVYENVLPQTHKLYQNYPNPFNPVTQIKYDLSKTANVKLSVYNIYGQLISVLANSKKHAGCHTIEFNGSNLNSGIYYYTLEIDGLVITKKMALIK